MLVVIKTKLLLRLDAYNDFPNLEVGHSCSKCGFLLSEDMCAILDNLPEFTCGYYYDIGLYSWLCC